jgi:hypothetical protein
MILILLDTVPRSLRTLIVSSLSDFLHSGRLQTTDCAAFWRILLLIYIRDVHSNDAKFNRTVTAFQAWLHKEKPTKDAFRDIAREILREFESPDDIRRIVYRPMWPDFLRLVLMVGQGLSNFQGTELVAFRSVRQDWARFQECLSVFGDVAPNFFAPVEEQRTIAP